jgi:hypothetical protein
VEEIDVTKTGDTFDFKMGFNTPPLGAVKTGGAGDLFPRIRKDFKEKSSIPRRSAAGIFYFKICDVCHCLKPTKNFTGNQNNLHGIIRSQTCRKCGTSIDKRARKTKRARQMEKQNQKKAIHFYVVFAENDLLLE